jgi:hypothetical protein
LHVKKSEKRSKRKRKPNPKTLLSSRQSSLRILSNTLACDPISTQQTYKRTPVVHLIVARINCALKQLIHLLLAHLLAQICQDVLDLAFADEARAVLVKHLEAANVLLDIEWFTEPAGAVEDLGEGFEVDCGELLVGATARRGSRELTVCANAALQVANLSERGVLPACAQQVAERGAVDFAVAALVEELEGFAVVGRGLGGVIHCCSLVCM